MMINHEILVYPIFRHTQMLANHATTTRSGPCPVAPSDLSSLRMLIRPNEMSRVTSFRLQRVSSVQLLRYMSSAETHVTRDPYWSSILWGKQRGLVYHTLPFLLAVPGGIPLCKLRHCKDFSQKTSTSKYLTSLSSSLSATWHNHPAGVSKAGPQDQGPC